MLLNGLYWQRSSGQVRGLGTKFSSLKFQESWVGHHSTCAVMLGGDKCTFNSLAVQSASTCLVDPEKVVSYTFNGMPQSGYTTLMVIVQDMVFLSGHSPGATESQGICQAWFIICDTAAGNGPYDGVLTPMASCRMGEP